MIRKATIYTFISAALTLSGCSDWLTLNPKSEIGTDALFKNPEGFTIALNGIYTNLSSPTLYGKELKFQFVDIIARCYDLSTSANEKLENYDYVSNGAEGTIASVWTLAYNSIANCNSILEQAASKKPDFFKDHEKNMIEGEALSLRALLYFDLLRLFAPAPAVKDEEAIPYYDRLSNAPMPYRKTSEILGWIITDLQRSKTLQKGFDTSTEAQSLFANLHSRFGYAKGFYGNGRRGLRMGYYATTALLAKVAQYAGETTLALENARELVEASTMLDLTSATIIENNTYDRLLLDDIIFALYNKDFEEKFNDYDLMVANVDGMFGTDNNDFRKKCYLTNAGEKMQLAKYIITENNDRERAVSIIPMFRLSEMYHIMIESLFDSAPDQATALFNTLRTKRGCKTPLPAISSKSELLNHLVNDARREFIGEGQLFFLYKRLNRPVIDERRGNQTLTDKFIIPVPKRETSMSN